MELTPPTPHFSGLAVKKTPPQGRIFEAVLLLVIVGLFYWFLISPKQNQLATAKTNVQNLQTQESGLANSKTKLEQAITDLHNHPDEVANMDEALPLDNRVTKLYIALNSLTQNSGMTVGNIGVAFNSGVDIAGNKTLLASPYASGRTLQKMTTSLVVSGSMAQFQALLQKLEDSGRLINITGISIVPAANGVFNFTLNLEAYYYGQ